MASSAEAREADLKIVVRSLVEQAATAHREASQARIEKKRAELKLTVFELTEERIKSVSDAAIKDLEADLEPEVARLEAGLKAARESGDRAVEFELAAQLGAALTVHARESAKLLAHTRQVFTAVRSEALQKVDREIDSLMNNEDILPLPAKITESVMKSYEDGEGGSEAYAAATKSGYASLRRWIVDHNAGWRFLAEGLLGGKAGTRLADLAEGLISKYGAKLEGALGEKSADLLSTVSKRLAKTSS